MGTYEFFGQRIAASNAVSSELSFIRKRIKEITAKYLQNGRSSHLKAICHMAKENIRVYEYYRGGNWVYDCMGPSDTHTREYSQGVLHTHALRDNVSITELAVELKELEDYVTNCTH
jgi:hypothetical protein